MDNELLDLVDRDDNVIGTINRTDYDRLIAENLGYIRAAELFLLNSQGQIYVPVRTAHKTIAPNGYDYSASGHIGAGEDYPAAMIREAQEELNIDISEDNLEFVAKAVTEKIRYIRGIFLMRSDETPRFNPNDFVSAEWLKPEEAIQKIDDGHPAKVSLRESIVQLQEYLAHHQTK